MTRASRITKYVQVGSLLLLGLLLFLWPFFEPVSKLLETPQIIGIITTILGGSVLYFDDRLSQMIKGPSGVIAHGTLGECIDDAFRGRKHVDRLRIAATSSEVIEALIASRDVRIGRCDLLLRRYPDGPGSYNARVEYALSEWRGLEAAGRVGELAVARYDSLPTEYQVIIDDDAIIFGAYVFRPSEAAQADFSPPSLIQNVSPEAAGLIKRFTDAFDANHAAWAKAEEHRP